jgi:hypothetical protein
MRMIDGILRAPGAPARGQTMTKLVALAALTLLAMAAAGAEPADSADAREAMVTAASEVYRSVGQGGGFVSGMFGIDRAALMQHALDDAERQNWQFWPTARVGLPLEYMSAGERRATHDLLAGALSSQGYLKAVHIMQLEQILDMLDEGGLPRSVDHYVLAIFGEPSLTAPWAWRFEGHHLSLSVTVAPEGVTVTPSFFGSNPAQVVSGPLAGFRVHGQVEELARQLVGSLDAEDFARVLVSDAAPREIATAQMNVPREQWDAWLVGVEPVGIEVGQLNEMQQHWIGLIVDEVIGNYRSGLQQAYRDGLDEAGLHFAWMGSTERGEPHYFRLQGEDFLYEYDNVQNGGNHVHSVWRSKGGDFGLDLLARHYAQEH